MAEVTERLNDIPSIVRQYAWNAFGLVLIAIGLIAVATYFPFRSMVYAPLERLLQNNAPVQDSSENEFGRASEEYDHMLAQIHALTDERE